MINSACNIFLCVPAANDHKFISTDSIAFLAMSQRLGKTLCQCDQSFISRCMTIIIILLIVFFSRKTVVLSEIAKAARVSDPSLHIHNINEPRYLECLSDGLIDIQDFYLTVTVFFHVLFCCKYRTKSCG